jgi:hypothetical protein
MLRKWKSARLCLGVFALLVLATPSLAQMDMEGMPGMDMSMPMTGGALGPYAMTREASGTSWQPDAVPHDAFHGQLGGWELMGHALLDGIYDSQSGPRGDTQWFVSGWLMGVARRDLDEGDVLNLRAMLSPEPFMGDRGYPLLLASGETADGKTPLLDRQHPHDLVMELSASYAHDFGQSDGVFLYAGYPGEPALGPPAFPHRASAMDIPEAPITHHFLDSTHIAFGVATLGYVHDDWKLEVSQFTGREPDQDRFDFDAARFDSTSARLSWNPDANWSLQASWGFLKSPEQLAPLLDETRLTASAQYFTTLGEGSLAATVAWGHKRLGDGETLDGFSFETEYKPDRIWTVFARAESAGSDELVAPALATVGKLSLGAIHDWPVGDKTALGLGALYDFDFAPRAYGSAPHGAMVFVRLKAG